MNAKEDILSNGGLEDIQDFTIFKRKCQVKIGETYKLLDRWYIKLTPTTTGEHGFNLCLRGYLADQTQVQSSAILAIETPRIITTSNSTYVLGDTSELFNHSPCKRFNTELLKSFQDGFPFNWRCIIEKEATRIRAAVEQERINRKDAQGSKKKDKPRHKEEQNADKKDHEMPAAGDNEVGAREEIFERIPENSDRFMAVMANIDEKTPKKLSVQAETHFIKEKNLFDAVLNEEGLSAHRERSNGPAKSPYGKISNQISQMPILTDLSAQQSVSSDRNEQMRDPKMSMHTSNLGSLAEDQAKHSLGKLADKDNCLKLEHGSDGPGLENRSTQSINEKKLPDTEQTSSSFRGVEKKGFSSARRLSMASQLVGSVKAVDLSLVEQTANGNKANSVDASAVSLDHMDGPNRGLEHPPVKSDVFVAEQKQLSAEIFPMSDPQDSFIGFLCDPTKTLDQKLCMETETRTNKEQVQNIKSSLVGYKDQTSVRDTKQDQVATDLESNSSKTGQKEMNDSFDENVSEESVRSQSFIDEFEKLVDESKAKKRNHKKKKHVQTVKEFLNTMPFSRLNRRGQENRTVQKVMQQPSQKIMDAETLADAGQGNQRRGLDENQVSTSVQVGHQNKTSIAIDIIEGMPGEEITGISRVTLAPDNENGKTLNPQARHNEDFIHADKLPILEPSFWDNNPNDANLGRGSPIETSLECKEVINSVSRTRLNESFSESKLNQGHGHLSRIETDRTLFPANSLNSPKRDKVKEGNKDQTTVVEQMQVFNQAGASKPQSTSTQIPSSIKPPKKESRISLPSIEELPKMPVKKRRASLPADLLSKTPAVLRSSRRQSTAGLSPKNVNALNLSNLDLSSTTEKEDSSRQLRVPDATTSDNIMLVENESYTEDTRKDSVQVSNNSIVDTTMTGTDDGFKDGLSEEINEIFQSCSSRNRQSTIRKDEPVKSINFGSSVDLYTEVLGDSVEAKESGSINIVSSTHSNTELNVSKVNTAKHQIIGDSEAVSNKNKDILLQAGSVEDNKFERIGDSTCHTYHKESDNKPNVLMNLDADHSAVSTKSELVASDEFSAEVVKRLKMEQKDVSQVNMSNIVPDKNKDQYTNRDGLESSAELLKAAKSASNKEVVNEYNNPKQRDETSKAGSNMSVGGQQHMNKPAPADVKEKYKSTANSQVWDDCILTDADSSITHKSSTKVLIRDKIPKQVQEVSFCDVVTSDKVDNEVKTYKQVDQGTPSRGSIQDSFKTAEPAELSVFNALLLEDLRRFDEEASSSVCSTPSGRKRKRNRLQMPSSFRILNKKKLEQKYITKSGRVVENPESEDE